MAMFPVLQFEAIVLIGAELRQLQFTYDQKTLVYLVSVEAEYDRWSTLRFSYGTRGWLPYENISGPLIQQIISLIEREQH